MAESIAGASHSGPAAAKSPTFSPQPSTLKIAAGFRRSLTRFFVFYKHKGSWKENFQLRTPADLISIAAAVSKLYIDSKQKMRQRSKKQARRQWSYNAPIPTLKYTLNHFVSKKASKYFWPRLAHCASLSAISLSYTKSVFDV